MIFPHNFNHQIVYTLIVCDTIQLHFKSTFFYAVILKTFQLEPICLPQIQKMQVAQQFAECQGRLAALELEIKEAKAKVLSAEQKVEKAHEEGKPSSALEKLLDSATSQLSDLIAIERELMKSKREFSLILASIDGTKEHQSAAYDHLPRVKNTGSYLGKANRFLFRTERWACVTAITKRKAITFAHTTHSNLQVGNQLKILSLKNGANYYTVKVTKKDPVCDWILLESKVDLCDEAPYWRLATDGLGYMLIGFSGQSQKESPLAVSPGMICSQRLNEHGHILGSSGSNLGDSGGPCFDAETGDLIGINVGCESTPFGLNDPLGHVLEKVASRYSSRALIIPITSFRFLI